MSNMDALDVVRLLALLFSFVGIIGSITSIREQRRDIPPEDYPKLTAGQQITATRMMTREIERLVMFSFFIIAASSNIARDYMAQDHLREAAALAVLLSLLAINFILMVGTFQDKKKTTSLRRVIQEKKAQEKRSRKDWLEAERLKDGNT